MRAKDTSRKMVNPILYKLPRHKIGTRWHSQKNAIDDWVTRWPGGLTAGAGGKAGEGRS